ncbi:phasin family protein [Sphingomonas sp. BT553]|uniref:Phasin family protein n=2 Tax=Sphingomonas mollis TaxID=2795726 RepID=A0ABS0XKM8_9SPHN|nr:phasin family protein [Sphingomonas sp. BT553]
MARSLGKDHDRRKIVSDSSITSRRAQMATEFQDQAKAGAEKMNEAGQKIAEQGSTIGAKIIDQVETNTREAFAAMRAATRAKDITEVMRIQSDYLRDQGNRAMTQAREVGELIMQFGKDAVTPFKQ